jgi:hypothetical protein
MTVESFQVSKFCLFVMVQPWNIGVCLIDQVFVTKLTVVIFFFHAAVLSIKTAVTYIQQIYFFQHSFSYFIYWSYSFSSFLIWIKIYYEFSLLHIFSLVIQPWMSAYIRKTDGVVSNTYHMNFECVWVHLYLLEAAMLVYRCL